MTMAHLAVLLILVTEGALIASHVTWAHPWWRKPLLWSDRWHLWSMLCHWPIVAFILWQHVPPAWWLPVSVASWALWQLVKLWAGKAWPPVWVQVWRWLRSRG